MVDIDAPQSSVTPDAAMSLSFEDIIFGYRGSRHPVLDGFSWTVPKGRTVLLGPNGAGKSTLLSLGADAIRPRRGSVRLTPPGAIGRPGRAAYRRAVGWMPQQVRAVPGLSAWEQVAYAGWLKGLGRGGAWESAAEALDRVGLAEQMDLKTSALSGGQLRRVGLAQVLVHDPQVLLLDEPTVGLDPAQRARFRDIFAALPSDRLIVVSTHQVDDLSELFDTVVVFQAGAIRFQGTVPEFMSLAPPNAERRAEAAYASIVGEES